MTKMPLFSFSLLPSKTLRPLLFLSPLPSPPPPIMAAAPSDADAAAAGGGGGGYPTPLSPPYPAASKDVELRRAMSAAARSGAYAAAEVVFEDEWLVVANKPPGIYCETLLSALADPRDKSFQKPSKTSTYCFKQSAGADTNQSNLHLANRLDRDTSGLMVITKCNKVAAKLVKAFTDHKVKKTYLALCIGNAPNWEKIKISSGHGRSKFGAFRVYSVKDVGRTLPGGSMVKHMETSFEVLGINCRGKFRERSDIEKDEIESIIVQEKGFEIFENEDGEKDEILVRAYPRSGRTHQIRLHCQYLGMPIKGDVKYGGVYEWKGETCDTHSLHAESLSFIHPITGLPLQFQAPLPMWASELTEGMSRDS